MFLKISIIEGGYHFEVVRSYALMLLHSGHQVSILTNKTSYDNLIDVLGDKVSWYIDGKKSFIEFLSDKNEILNKQDLVICTSPQDVFGNFIKKKWNTKSYLVIHDLHNDFDVWNNLSLWKNFDLITILKSIKYLFNQYYQKRTASRQTFDKVIFPSVIMNEYAMDNYFVQDALTLPFLWNEKLSPIHERDFIKITIPGTIKQRSRDYDYCIRLFERLKSIVNVKIQVVILGQALNGEAKVIINKFINLQSEKLSIKTFNESIDQKTFDEELFDSDLLLLPLQSRWQFGVVDEIGGLTCLSGNIGDMVRFAVPSLLPEHYKLSKELESLSMRFSMKDLDKDIELITKILNQKDYNIIKQKTNEIVKSVYKNYSKLQ